MSEKFITHNSREMLEISYDRKSVQLFEGIFIEDLIKTWKFYEPPIPLVAEILRLNEELGDEHMNREYEQLSKTEGSYPELDEEAVADKSWLMRLFNQVSEIIFHDREDRRNRPRASEDESLSFFQKFVAERIYNHLAMLSRSPHAKKGGTFSIREELTEEIAEKLGLGLYLDEKTGFKLRAQTEATLLELAGDFQQWFTEKLPGIYSTTWGVMYTPDKAQIGRGNLNPVILIPDVEKKATPPLRQGREVFVIQEVGQEAAKPVTAWEVAKPVTAD